MTLGKSLIIVLIIIIIAYPDIKYRYSFHRGMPIEDIRDFAAFNTGDIIMTKYDSSAMYYAKNGINFHMTMSKCISDSIQYYSQGHYTHCGVIVVLDQPYVYHMTDDICFDNIRGEYISCVPTLVKLTDMNGYRGMLYHYKRKRPANIPPEVTKLMINNTRDAEMQGNIFKAIMANGLKIINSDHKKYMCADLAMNALYHMGLAATPTMPINLADILEICDKDYCGPVIIRNSWYKHINSYRAN